MRIMPVGMEYYQPKIERSPSSEKKVEQTVINNTVNNIDYTITINGNQDVVINPVYGSDGKLVKE